MRFSQLLFFLDLVISRIGSLFSQTAKKLHNARFAALHELSDMMSVSLPEESLLLGATSAGQILRVKQTKQRRELGNLLVVAPTRAGKGCQLLSWRHSVVVNDIKGELYDQTAGYRATLGKVFIFDPDGTGNRFDPLITRTTEKDLLSSATHLLHRPGEGKGRIFTERATVQLTQLFLAARSENMHPLPYTRQMVRLGLIGAAKRLFRLSPALATQFLDADFQDANFDDRFLASSWGTLSARMRLLLTDSVVKSFTGRSSHVLTFGCLCVA